jgi:sarcosine oxidase
MIRKAYFEDAAYVPLLLRAYDAWRELEAETALEILHVTGVLMVGAPLGTILEGARRTALAQGLAYEDLSREEVGRRFPQFAMRDGEVALYEPDGGFLIPEDAIEAHLRVAESGGAELRFSARVVRWYPAPSGGLRIELDDGSTLDAARLALCEGPWMGDELREAGVPIAVQRNVQYWFESAGDRVTLGNCPAFFADRPDQPSRLYGFPDHGFGIKAAFHGYGDGAEPQTLDREVRPGEVEEVRRALDHLLPGAAGRYLGGKACMYARTPDDNFVIAPHPADARVVIAGGFSGHGFKFAPVVGEIVASLLFEGGTPHEIGFLAPQRFARAAQ